jgi:glyoxylase-like metal-dependent hydrolase (beta-lactamase superfamily II)
MNVEVLTLGPVQTNCYIVSQGDSCVIIDPADRADRIINHLNRKGLTCKGLLLTHGHFDHMAAVDELCEAFDVECYIHAEDVDMLSDPRMNASAYFGVDLIVDSVYKSVRCFYGSFCKLCIDRFEFEAIHSPGHSKGSCCYHIGDSLFVGDLLFSSSCGRTDLYGGNTREIISSIKNIVENFDGATMIYPGHDSEFTLDYAKANNYVIRDYVLK